MQAVEVLKHEHRVIGCGLAVLEVMAHRMEQGETVPVDKVQTSLEFFRVFADQCHHGKELVDPATSDRNLCSSADQRWFEARP